MGCPQSQDVACARLGQLDTLGAALDYWTWARYNILDYARSCGDGCQKLPNAWKCTLPEDETMAESSLDRLRMIGQRCYGS